MEKKGNKNKFISSLQNIFTGRKGFGMFLGVFVPTFLSIIGVILFLRLGYIVGSAGILLTIVIILLTVSVTLSTGLALSSITTTIRIGAGGAFSIVSKTLGLEVGGSVGIPLALAQMLSVVFYIFGFTEALSFLLPDLPVRLVGLGVLAVLFILTFIKVNWAVRTQFFVFILIVLSLIAVFSGGGAWWSTVLDTPLFLRQEAVPFWALFALFFPAATGLMSGIGLSGELTDPKNQIPRGVMWAIGITTIIYIFAAFWLGYTSTPDELVSNTLIMVEKAAFSPLVLAGILAATFSSALTMFVSASRLIQALGESGIIPFSDFFAKKSKQGEPRRAVIFMTLLLVFALFIGSLNSIAAFLTMVFLITYGIINLVVFTEMALGLVSFRPTFRIPIFVPFYGFVASIIFMFLVNIIAGIIALLFLFGVYAILVQRNLKAKEGDVRSGLFVMIAEWAAKRILRMAESTQLTWKPNVLLPVVITRTLLGNFPLIKAIAYPNGTMTVLGIRLKKPKDAPDAKNLTKKIIEQDLRELPDLVEKFGREGIFTASSIVDVEDYTSGINVSLSAMTSQIFHPNVLFLPYRADRLAKRDLSQIMKTSKKQGVGLVITDRDEEIGLGAQKDIHIWISPKVIEKEFYDFQKRRFDLGVLIGYQLSLNWKGRMHLWMCVPENNKSEAQHYLKKLVYEARLPTDTQTKVSTDTFTKTLKTAPQGDIHIVPIKEDDIDFILKTSERNKKSFLFVLDSSKEDIMA
jgi:amino acid transporter